MSKGGDLFTIKSDKTGLKRLTNRGDILNAEWSPDKSKIAFTAEVNGNTDVYLMSSTGTGTRRLTFGAARDEDVTWSSNGKALLFTSFTNCTSDIFKVNVAPGSRPVRFTRAQCDSVSDHFERADWHPDGTKILVWHGYYDGGPAGLPRPGRPRPARSSRTWVWTSSTWDGHPTGCRSPAPSRPTTPTPIRTMSGCGAPPDAS